MPPSPANYNRMRSESMDAFLSIKTPKNLFNTTKNIALNVMIDPISIEYWLPSYEDVSECDFDLKELNMSLNKANISYNSNKSSTSTFNYDLILSKYHSLKRYMTYNQL